MKTAAGESAAVQALADIIPNRRAHNSYLRVFYFPLEDGFIVTRMHTVFKRNIWHKIRKKSKTFNISVQILQYCISAVDQQVRADHIRGKVAAEEQDRVCNLRGLGKAPDGVQGDLGADQLFWKLVQQGRIHITRRDAVHADAERRIGRGLGTGEIDHAGLADRVVRFRQCEVAGIQRSLRPGGQFDRLLVLVDEMSEGDGVASFTDCLSEAITRC